MSSQSLNVILSLSALVLLFSLGDSRVEAAGGAEAALQALGDNPDLSSLLEGADMSGLPSRPQVFSNAEQLRDYLRTLNEYFAIVGRPRFGRSVDRLFAARRHS